MVCATTLQEMNTFWLDNETQRTATAAATAAAEEERIKACETNRLFSVHSSKINEINMKWWNSQKKECSFKQNDFGSAFFSSSFQTFQSRCLSVIQTSKIWVFLFLFNFHSFSCLQFYAHSNFGRHFSLHQTSKQTLRLKSCRGIERNKQTCSHILKSHLFLWLNSRTIRVKRKNAAAVQIAFNKEPNQLISFCFVALALILVLLRRNKT